MRKLIAIFTGLAIGLLSTTALAEVVCNPRDFVLEQLAKKYKEAPIAFGVTNRGGLVEVLSTVNGDTWTILISTPDGQSCLVASGEGWRAVPQPVDEGPAV